MGRGVRLVFLFDLAMAVQIAVVAAGQASLIKLGVFYHINLKDSDSCCSIHVPRLRIRNQVCTQTVVQPAGATPRKKWTFPTHTSTLGGLCFVIKFQRTLFLGRVDHGSIIRSCLMANRPDSAFQNTFVQACPI